MDSQLVTALCFGGLYMIMIIAFHVFGLRLRDQIIEEHKEAKKTLQEMRDLIEEREETLDDQLTKVIGKMVKSIGS